VTIRRSRTRDRGSRAPACWMRSSFTFDCWLSSWFGQTKPNDFGPATFHTDWSPPERASAKNLNEYWLTASKFVVHFGHERVPADIADLDVFNPSAANIRRMTADVFDVHAGSVVSHGSASLGRIRRRGAALEEFVSAVEIQSAEGEDWLKTKRASLLRREKDAAAALLASH
jgi:hypothetical protein